MTLVVIGILAALTAVVALVVRLAWRTREVDFIWRAPVGDRIDTAAAELFDRIMPVLVGQGFRMVASAGNTTVFERRYTRGSSVLFAVILFPVGLIFVLFRGRETLTVITANTTLELQGSANKPLADWVGAVTRDVALGSGLTL